MINLFRNWCIRQYLKSIQKKNSPNRYLLIYREIPISEGDVVHPPFVYDRLSGIKKFIGPDEELPYLYSGFKIVDKHGREVYVEHGLWNYSFLSYGVVDNDRQEKDTVRD